MNMRCRILRIASAATLAAAMIVPIGSDGLGGAAVAATLSVRAGASIQSAIDAAAAGDVVEVHPGIYRGNLKISRPLTLKGIGRPTVSGAS